MELPIDKLEEKVRVNIAYINDQRSILELEAENEKAPDADGTA
ncbi:MAG: hypothetical protein AAB726_00475 [Patescibacteria group bacterium]